LELSSSIGHFYDLNSTGIDISEDTKFEGTVTIFAGNLSADFTLLPEENLSINDDRIVYMYARNSVLNPPDYTLGIPSFAEARIAYPLQTIYKWSRRREYSAANPETPTMWEETLGVYDDYTIDRNNYREIWQQYILSVTSYNLHMGRCETRPTEDFMICNSAGYSQQNVAIAQDDLLQPRIQFYREEF
jgi:hypothetical protein